LVPKFFLIDFFFNIFSRVQLKCPATDSMGQKGERSVNIACQWRYN